MPMFRILLAAVLASCLTAAVPAEEAKSDNAVTIVVMDPLAKPLSCPCVAGYAQRDYEKLAAALQERLGREVKIVFNESLVAALKKEGTQADIVIGKQSVILHDAEAAQLQLKKVAML